MNQNKFKNEFQDIFGEIFNTAFDVENHSQYNVLENENEYRVDLYLPGNKKSDFSIDVEGDLLTISYDKKGEEMEEGYQYHKRGYKTTTFNKTFKLSRKFDLEKITAEYKDGVLKVSVPKTEESKKTTFNIKVN